MELSTVVDPVKRAKAAADARIALVASVHKRGEKIAGMMAKLQEEQGLYGEEYQAALAAWSRDDLDGFGLAAPDQLGIAGGPRRSMRRAAS